MDKLVIFGGYEYLGFYLSTAFLDKGLHVHCIHFNFGEELIYDEKRFTVGRNANFEETPFKEWKQSSNDELEKTLMVISLYDYSFNNGTHREKDIDEQELFKSLLNRNLANCEFLFLLPIQCLARQNECKEYKEFRIELIKKDIKLKEVYIPTLYGPWQPNEYLFQQAILRKLTGRWDYQLSEKEWCYDAIYIEDAVEEIGRIVEENTIEACLLQSEVVDHWQKCASFLQIDQHVYKEVMTQERNLDSVPCIKVKDRAGFDKGLKAQIEYVKRLLVDFQ